MMYDATRFIEPGMEIYPGDPPFAQTVHYTIETHGARVHKLEMGNHTGTHMDAPSHFLKDGISLDEVGLEPGIGPCRVAVLTANDVAAVKQLAPQQGERLLLSVEGPLSEEVAEYLAQCKLTLLGTTHLTVGGTVQHHAILGAGTLIIEGLKLEGISEGRYRMVALPLKLKDANGAPARVVLWNDK